MAGELLIQPLAEEFILTKSSKSFDKLYNRILPGVRHYIWGIGKTYLDYDSLEDVQSRTFYKALLNINSYDYTKANFSTWIFAIARNEVFNELRSLKRSVHLGSYGNSDYDFDSMEIDVAYIDGVIDKDKYEVKFNDIIENDELYKRRRDIIVLIMHEINKELGPLYRDIMLDREINNLSYKELAVKYDLPINTVKSRLKIGRELVKNAIQEDVNKIKREMEENYGK